MRNLAADAELKFLSINTGSVRAHGDLLTIIEAAKRRGISMVSPWREQVAAVGLNRAAKALRAGGFSLSSYCRAGLFPADASQRQEVRDDNRRAVDEAAELNAACLVVVVGGLPQFTRAGAAPSKDIARSRAEVHDGIAELLEYAAPAGVKIAIEPLHPMTAAQRSCVNTLRQALDICDALDGNRSRGLGLTVDVYHIWWDFEVYEQNRRIGGDRLHVFHISDWLVPTDDMLSGRGMMGDGVIEIPKLRAAVEAEGYAGPCVVEVLSSAWAARPLDEFLATAIERYRTVC
jgi:sugar phosphate isomerase/epimerase